LISFILNQFKRQQSSKYNLKLCDLKSLLLLHTKRVPNKKKVCESALRIGILTQEEGEEGR
jgi:hypothetical protein